MFINFLIGLTMDVVQSVIYGLFAYWFAGRTHLWVRIVGGVVTVLIGWLSVVVIIDRATGHPARGDLDTNIPIMVALFIGWIAGRNNRRRTTKKPMLLDKQVRAAGVGIIAFSYVYGALGALVGFVVGLGIVSDTAGFLGVIIGLFIAPITFFIAPLWAGFKQHNWLPALLVYGSTVTASLTFWFGRLVSAITD